MLTFRVCACAVDRIPGETRRHSGQACKFLHDPVRAAGNDKCLRSNASQDCSAFIAFVVHYSGYAYGHYHLLAFAVRHQKR
jgi:hypothetical protein